jgi:hypothetical protein
MDVMSAISAGIAIINTAIHIRDQVRDNDASLGSVIGY